MTTRKSYLLIHHGDVIEVNLRAIVLEHGDKLDLEEFRGCRVMSLVHFEVFLMESLHIVH